MPYLNILIAIVNYHAFRTIPKKNKKDANAGNQHNPRKKETGYYSANDSFSMAYFSLFDVFHP